MASYQRYSHHARRALTHANQLAARFQHPHIDTGHLLVGVIRAEGSVGSHVMADFDLPANVAEVYIKRLITPTDSPPHPIPNDPALDKALELAVDESNWLAHHYIGTEHMLLGITRANVGNAITLLRLVDIAPEQIRRRVRQALQDGHQEFSLEVARRNARLSELSRRVLFAAEQMAVSMDHPVVGLGHLLVAMLDEKRGPISNILLQSGLKPDLLRQGVNDGRTKPLVSIELILDTAHDQAKKFGSHYVGTDHLLLTLTIIPAGEALLQMYGASPKKVARLLNKHMKR